MTDKEILIDGVNVAECKYFYKYSLNEYPNKTITDCELHDRNDEDFERQCHRNPNCYFKQLAREKQRADDNQKLSDELEKVIQEGANTIQELKQKNEELEKKIKHIHNILTEPYNYGSFTKIIPTYILHIIFNENIEDVFKGNLKAIKDDETVNKTIRLEQALKEIREIAENIVEKDVYENSDIKAQNIISKIDEVLGDK